MRRAGTATTQRTGNTPVEAISTRAATALCAATVLALVVAMWSLDAFGMSSRTAPASTKVVVVQDSRGLLEEWDEAGVHGVVLVSATRDTQFQLQGVTEPEVRSWPVELREPATQYLAEGGRSTAIWVAAMTGAFRTVDYVIPARELAKKISDGRRQGAPGVSADGRSVTANDNGYLRHLRDRAPEHLGTPAVLNIDASYFVSGTADELRSALGGSLDSYRLVTLNRAMEATDVPEAARIELDRIAQAFSRGESW